MKYKGFIIPRQRYITRLSKSQITAGAKQRLAWMDYYDKTRNGRLTCRHFGISPDTFYHWKRKYLRNNLQSLEIDPKNRRPLRLRIPETPTVIVERVRFFREQYPRWGKEKLARLLWREGLSVSVSTVGRTITRLKERGLLKEPIPNFISSKKRFIKRSWAVRKPEELKAFVPGDLVQIDTLDVRPVPAVIRKQFTARDVISKWDTVRVYGSASSVRAAAFLDDLVSSSPFPIKGAQIDGGSEFKGEFEKACKQKGIALYVLPPRSPKLNGCVERSNRTHTEEFYEVNDFSFDIKELNEELKAWALVYNTIRPHQGLDYLTPLEYINKWKQMKGECVRYVLN